MLESRCRVLLIASALLLAAGSILAQPTPPVVPKTVEVQLPAPVELPPPDRMPEGITTAPIAADEAAAIALFNQPSVTVAGAGIEAAKGRTAQARAGLKPRVGVSAALNTSEVSGAPAGSSGGAPSHYQLGAAVEQLIYDYDHTRDLVRQAQEQENVATAALTTVQADLVLGVKQAFYGLLEAQRLVTVAESNVRNQQQHLALAQARLTSGLGLPYDVVRAQTAYTDAVYGLTVSRNRASQARVALVELMGLDPRTPLVPAESVEPPPATEAVGELVNQAQQQRPEVLRADAAIRAAQFAVSAARTVNSPQVSGSLGMTRRGDDFFPSTNVTTLGVELQWTPFDAGYTKGRVQEAEANLVAARAQLDAVRLQVTGEVSQAYLDLKTAEQRAVTAETEVTNAREALRLAEGRYRAGLGVFIDVLDAQTALDVANINQVNAQTAVEQARAALEYSTGTGLARLRAVMGERK